MYDEKRLGMTYFKEPSNKGRGSEYLNTRDLSDNLDHKSRGIIIIIIISFLTT